MTSLTGSTAHKFAPTRDPPSFALAMFGATAQIGVAGYLWFAHTSARACLLAPWACVSDPARSDPWGVLLLSVVTSAACIFIWSVCNRDAEGHPDTSVVDRLWSIEPCVFVWYCFYASYQYPLYYTLFNDRALLMALLVTLWAVRLTFNFWRKGGFSGGEDYRWKEVRGWFPGWRFEFFNLWFIAVFQQLLILGFTTPAVVAMKADVPLGWLDAAACALFLLFWAGETVADAQMFDFQTEKYRRLREKIPLGASYSRGFVETGLWRYSRHPNYFCEVMLWWAFYLFSVAASGEWLNWTIIGDTQILFIFFFPLLLLLLLYA